MCQYGSKEKSHERMLYVSPVPYQNMAYEYQNVYFLAFNDKSVPKLQ